MASHTPGAASPSPSESSPAPGEWTLEDLKVGATVPKEDLERLFPTWDKPTPPATLTENSEQGAKEAAVYFDQLADYAFYFLDASIIDELDDGVCENCDDLRATVDEAPKAFYASVPEVNESHALVRPESDNVYEVRIQLTDPLAVELTSFGGQVQAVYRESESDNFTTLAFVDGKWSPVFIKLTRSHM